jgi:membrane-associated protease RseP (regulator of RpoE activity)
VQPKEDGPVEEAAPSTAWRTALVVVLALALGFRLGVSTVVIILALVVMIFLHELGHYLTAKWAGMKVTEFFIGFGPRLWSFHRGETEYGLKAIPAGAYVRIIGMSNLEEIDPADEERTYRSKPYWRRLSVAVAGSTMHFILAFGLIFTIFAGIGLPDSHSSDWTVASVVKEPASAAFDAGIRPHDHIASVDGHTFSDFKQMSEYLRARPGETVQLVVQRGSRTFDATATLATRNPRTGEHVGFLGVGPTYPTERKGPVSAVVESGKQFGSLTKATVQGLVHIFSPKGVSHYVDTIVKPDADTKAGVPDAGRPTSIVGIVQVGGQLAHEGWVNVLYLLFGVNVFIGLFNLLPMLPFDGGHVAIATYEKIRSMISGRRYQADVAKLLPFTYVVVAALALLFVTSIYMDIAHPISID